MILHLNNFSGGGGGGVCAEILSFVILSNLIWVAVLADDQHLLRCEPARFVLLSIILHKYSPFLLFLLIPL